MTADRLRRALPVDAAAIPALGLLVVLVIVGASNSDRFLTDFNIANVLIQTTPLLLVALGQMFVVGSGGLDLSIGSVVSLVTVIVASLASGMGLLPALLIGVAAALGAAISMGLSEGLSDDGTITGRGKAVTRGLITGVATFVGGFAHALPFLISDVGTALAVAYPVVGAELILIAWIRKRFQNVSLTQSLIQVTLGGALVAGVGFVVGHA